MSPSLHNFAPHREGSSNCRPCYNQSARTLAFGISPKAGEFLASHNPPKLARLGDCGLKGVGAKFAYLWRAHGRLEPASGENQVWPIGRFAIGGRHVRSRPGDDDFMAVELDMKIHGGAYHKERSADRSRRWKEKPRRSGDAPGLVWF